MIMKKLLALLLVLALVTVGIGCGGGSTSTKKDGTPSASKPSDAP